MDIDGEQTTELSLHEIWKISSPGLCYFPQAIARPDFLERPGLTPLVFLSGSTIGDGLKWREMASRLIVSELGASVVEAIVPGNLAMSNERVVDWITARSLIYLLASDACFVRETDAGRITKREIDFAHKVGIPTYSAETGLQIINENTVPAFGSRQSQIGLEEKLRSRSFIISDPCPRLSQDNEYYGLIKWYLENGFGWLESDFLELAMRLETRLPAELKETKFFRSAYSMDKYDPRLCSAIIDGAFTLCPVFEFDVGEDNVFSDFWYFELDEEGNHHPVHCVRSNFNEESKRWEYVRTCDVWNQLEKR